MGRWEPGTRGRLAQNALELFAERGFEATTAAEIAERAGVTERTFFRHFADKRDALFHGGELLEAHLADVVARSEGSALELVRAALGSAAAAVETNPERARTRDAVIATHPELRERELTKMDGLVTALRSALRAKGVPDPSALLAAETGVAVFKVGFTRWAARPGSDLPTVLAAAFDELADLLGTTQR
ncbi:TetR family transcriptional regulator [Kineococcus rhizosphaerae]|uniref:TetR family transcriptional regulator n=1 Tax=Kineococcus rhizosphaerae TaxID=559628 RepID=A0A2T0R7J5_9ACTN|nr:TetR family transcriptional regulator [Kineococcus rhizosphaerae]PRY17122.1 TetR family transcriptional regulator [Kineococcus rhizosphaerae]